MKEKYLLKCFNKALSCLCEDYFVFSKEYSHQLYYYLLEKKIKHEEFYKTYLKRLFKIEDVVNFIERDKNILIEPFVFSKKLFSKEVEEIFLETNKMIKLYKKGIKNIGDFKKELEEVKRTANSDSCFEDISETKIYISEYAEKNMLSHLRYFDVLLSDIFNYFINENSLIRLGYFMKNKKLTQAELGDDIGMSQTGISSIINKKSSVQKSHSLLLKSAYNLNPDWLLRGEEPMYLPQPKPSFSDEQQANLNDNYEQVREDGRNRIYTTSKDELQKEKERLRLQEKLKEEERATFYSNLGGVVEVPVLGYVVAGEPKEIYEVEDGVTGVPEFILKKHGAEIHEVYCLRVRGDSMIECGIAEDNLICVFKTGNIKNRDVVVANIDGEKTVKKFFHIPTKKVVELRPCNIEYETMKFPEMTVDILGKVIYSGKEW